MKRSGFKKAKTPKKKHEDYLDDLWRTIIRFRDRGIDQYSFIERGIKKPGFDAHHIITRSNRRVRWDTRNGILVQAMHNYGVMHKEPEKFRRFLKEKWFKDGEYKDLHIRAEISGQKIDRSLIELQLVDELSRYTTLPEDWNCLSYYRKSIYLATLRKVL